MKKRICRIFMTVKNYDGRKIYSEREGRIGVFCFGAGTRIKSAFGVLDHENPQTASVSSVSIPAAPLGTCPIASPGHHSGVLTVCIQSAHRT